MSDERMSDEVRMANETTISDQIVKQWVFRSEDSTWHEVSPVTGADGVAKTLCGQTIDKQLSAMHNQVECPGVARCETCHSLRSSAEKSA